MRTRDGERPALLVDGVTPRAESPTARTLVIDVHQTFTREPTAILIDTIQPFPTFSEIYLAALMALRSEIATARRVEGVA